MKILHHHKCQSATGLELLNKSHFKLRQIKCTNLLFEDWWMTGWPIDSKGWRRHSSFIFLILLFTKPNIEVSGWLYQTKTHFTHIVYQPFSRVSPPSFTLYDINSVSSNILIYILHFIEHCDQDILFREKQFGHWSGHWSRFSRAQGKLG